ncbi:MAG: amidohydrolase [Peptococcaceae bacterium]|jgi:aminobenzoyl-glutamate utilization protein A|nr:amidohydrolase [Peptococcaceae bacterium]
MDVIGLRREFHQYPELAFREFRTAGRVVELLQSLGYEVLCGEAAMEPSVRKSLPAAEEMEAAYQSALAAGANPAVLEKMRGGLTAVVASLRGKEPGPVVAFRFDMDALPVRESEDPEHPPLAQGFRSQWEGKMHACGHDGHTAIGLALAREMATGDFAGTLKLIFQPAEEGVCGGALSIVHKGLVDDVDYIFCLHLMANMELGEVYAATRYLASSKIEVEFFGTPAHAGGAPEKGRNALLGAATALLNIHAIPPYPGQEVRINVGVIQGGTAANIIPDYAKLILETRAKSGEVNSELFQRVERVVQGSAQIHGLQYQLKLMGEAATCEADPPLVALVMEEARQAGFSRIHERYDASVSEDGPYLIQRVQQRGGQGTFMSVGTGTTEAHHTTRFDIREESLPLTVGLLSRMARRILKPEAP